MSLRTLRGRRLLLALCAAGSLGTVALDAAADPSAARGKECAQFAARTPDVRQFPEVDFMTACRNSADPPADVWDAGKEKAQKARGARIAADRAANPPDKARASARNACDGQNRSGMLQLDCACTGKEADRHLAENKLSSSAIAQLQFDFKACIDRKRSAERYVSNFSGNFGSGIDRAGMLACYRKAIETDMDVASLTDYGSLRGELSRLCKPVAATGPRPKTAAQEKHEDELRRLRAQTPAAQVAQRSRSECEALNARRGVPGQIKLDCGCIEKASVRAHATGHPSNAEFESLDKAPCLDRERSAAAAAAYCQGMRNSTPARCACLVAAVRNGTVPASTYVQSGLGGVMTSLGHKCPAG